MKKLLSFIMYCAFSSSLYSADFITFGTGELNGTYYPTGNFLCKFMNKITQKTNIRCSVESTDGSVYNINAIESGEFNFAIAQADTIYQAVHGLKKFNNHPSEKLRSVMAIYPELFTLITRKDAAINKLTDIKGKRVNLGNLKSGSEFTTLELFKAFNINKESLSLSSSLKIEDTEDALIDNEIDAYFFMVGHPAETIQNAAISTPISI
ncbi:MAG: TAXI family TRAP transporter solute-binding subunit, partial [Campylobacteraceae bacterium]|nr:TAXI family TRAP transporter solute-binding subunit [Campylobacteraceae bacterium]